MKIVSGRLGEIDIDAAKIITFPDGIIGFPEYLRYIELEFMENSPLRLLQAVDAPDLGFILIDPVLFHPGYTAAITHEDIRSLNADSPDQLQVCAIVTIPDDPYEMTANLQGPLIINPVSGLAKQIINHDQAYTTKHKIIAGKPAPSAK